MTLCCFIYVNQTATRSCDDLELVNMLSLELLLPGVMPNRERNRLVGFNKLVEEAWPELQVLSLSPALTFLKDFDFTSSG